MKIVLYISSLLDGGAERVLTLLANEFSERKNKIVIITKGPYCSYPLSKKICWKPIFTKYNIEKRRSLLDKVSRRFTYIPKLFSILKREKPDIVISFLLNENGKLILVSKFLGIPIIVSEHTNFHVDMSISSWVKRRWIYKLSDAVTVLTKYDYDNYYKYFLKNVYIMPNPVSFNSINKIANRKKIILASGSLDRWSIKGFDNLLEIFANVVKKHPDWKLAIAGSGDEGKKYLIQLAGELDIENNIDFLGFCKNIDKVMQSSSIFIVTSRYEGFSMVLVEAMSQGCSCISYDCIAGPGEIIENGIDGILVENQNIHKMSSEINRLIEKEELQLFLAENAINSVRRFSVEKVGNKWIDLIDKVIKKRRMDN